MLSFIIVSQNCLVNAHLPEPPPLSGQSTLCPDLYPNFQLSPQPSPEPQAWAIPLLQCYLWTAPFPWELALTLQRKELQQSEKVRNVVSWNQRNWVAINTDGKVVSVVVIDTFLKC